MPDAAPTSTAPSIPDAAPTSTAPDLPDSAPTPLSAPAITSSDLPEVKPPRRAPIQETHLAQSQLSTFFTKITRAEAEERRLATKPEREVETKDRLEYARRQVALADLGKKKQKTEKEKEKKRRYRQRKKEKKVRQSLL